MLRCYIITGMEFFKYFNALTNNLLGKCQNVLATKGQRITVLTFKDGSMEGAKNDSQVFETCFQLFPLVTYLNIMEHKSRGPTAKMRPLKM